MYIAKSLRDKVSVEEARKAYALIREKFPNLVATATSVSIVAIEESLFSRRVSDLPILIVAYKRDNLVSAWRCLVGSDGKIKVGNQIQEFGSADILPRRLSKRTPEMHLCAEELELVEFLVAYKRPVCETESLPARTHVLRSALIGVLMKASVAYAERNQPRNPLPVIAGVRKKEPQLADLLQKLWLGKARLPSS